MSTETETETPRQERNVPKPVFTDAEAGSQEFPSSTSRSYNYFTPAKRRASVYEDVTVDVQPDPARHLTQGWIYGFADGTSGYPQEWSALKSTDWHKFLDPNYAETHRQALSRGSRIGTAPKGIPTSEQRTRRLASGESAQCFEDFAAEFKWSVVKTDPDAWPYEGLEPDPRPTAADYSRPDGEWLPRPG